MPDGGGQELDHVVGGVVAGRDMLLDKRTLDLFLEVLLERRAGDDGHDLDLPRCLPFLTPDS